MRRRFWFTPPERPALAARLLAPFAAWLARPWRYGRFSAPAEPSLSATPEQVSNPERPARVVALAAIAADPGAEGDLAFALVSRLQAAGRQPVVLWPDIAGPAGTGKALSMALPVARPLDPRNAPAARNMSEAAAQRLAAMVPVLAVRDPQGGLASTLAQVARDGADIALLMDGFGPPGLLPGTTPDATILTASLPPGLGNARLRPAGPLRAPAAALAASGAPIVAIETEGRTGRLAARWRALGGGVVTEARLSLLATGIGWRGFRVMGISALPVPETVFAALEASGARVLGCHAMPEDEDPVQLLKTRLMPAARRVAARLVTTEEDALRLPPELRREVMVLPLRLEIADWRSLDEALGLAPQPAVPTAGAPDG